MILLNRATTIKLFCCEKFGAIKFHKGQGAKLDRFEKFLRYSILFFYFMELVFTVIDLYISSSSREESRSSQTSKKIQSEMEYIGLDIVQITLTLSVIYGLFVY